MVAADPLFDELVSTVARHLEIDHQYVTHLSPERADEIARVRSAGRKAGRMLGRPVRTFQTDPARRSDGLVVVWVLLLDPPESDEERMQERGQLLTEHMWRSHPRLD